MTKFLPQWYQEAIIYELHIRAFFDSNNDGNGDFIGLIEKLDYLQDLGVTAIWMLPFYPSPLKDDGYDIADYTRVNPAYGHLNDVKSLIYEAHRRNIRIITELVMNHTSDQHPWFQRARKAKSGSKWRNFYVWSDSGEEYKDARIIFKDFESSNWTWDSVANAYYWHRFYSHQPDLNFENKDVQKAVLGWIDFWLNLGVDGLRLDAVPYLYEKEGTNCENLEETHQFLKIVRKHIDENFNDRMLLAEANQWPEDAVAYFGQGDECNMAFHFPLMPRMFMSLRMEDRFPLVDIIQQTPAIPANCQWAIFLRNHDELTLEMVTDEERDYMYRYYAEHPKARINLGIRRRLAPLLNNNRKKIELLNALLFSLPGTPVIYYGDEIGMGDNFFLGDRNGVRTPMQWEPNKNAGFSKAHPQSLYLPLIVDPEYHYETVNVANQQNNTESLLWWTKHLIELRKKFPAFALGTIRLLFPENPKIFAFINEYQTQTILVVANFSRYPEQAELDLTEWEGKELFELFGHTSFQTIKNTPYTISLNAYGFFWFLIKQKDDQTAMAATYVTQKLDCSDCEDLLQPGNRSDLEKILSFYLVKQRWFAAKGHNIKKLKVIEMLSIPMKNKNIFTLLIQVNLFKDEEEIYCLSIASVNESEAKLLKKQYPQSIIANLTKSNKYLIDAYFKREFTLTLLNNIAENKKIKGLNGKLIAKSLHKIRYKSKLEAQPIKTEQSNTSIIFDQSFILKNYRRCQQGINPDIEIGKFLTEKAEFKNTPRLLGYTEYKDERTETIILSALHEYIPHEYNAWDYTLENVNRFFEIALSVNPVKRADLYIPSPLRLFGPPIQASEEIKELLGEYIHLIYLLGQRTAEMHAALASDDKDENFAPLPFSTLYQRSLYQSIKGLLGRTIHQLNKKIPQMDEFSQEIISSVLKSQPSIDAVLKKLLENKISGMRIRCHGDFHLGQVLFTGKDFFIVDFEGEPARSLSERRIKRSPLRDIAGMLRSFHYATQADVMNKSNENLEYWGKFWYGWCCAYFLNGYKKVSSQNNLLSPNAEENSILLQALMLEKTIYEINYELNNRPDWLLIPCKGLLDLLQ